jgi:alpha-beta hydrolase superfamily lysophospholipase
MHGTADRITSHKATQQFAEKGNGSIDLVLFDDYYHEIHNDLGKEKVITQMVDWLNETIEK